jgi:putative nucleotidyltransferase with HDIG domain
MLKKLQSYTVEHMEHVVVAAILVATVLIGAVVPQKTALLNFFYLPIIISGYFLGYRKAVLQAVLSILYISVCFVYSPEAFGTGQPNISLYSNVAAWAGFLILSGAIVGRLADRLNVEVAQRRRAYTAAINALSMALDYRDQSTSGHSRRVADLTTGMARYIGIREVDLLQIEQGALLHDIGKLKIPETILWKPAALNAEEWSVMRRHTEYGYEFVRNLDFLQDAAEIVRCHHEKFDGSGYPRGLQGEEIPIGARLFAIVDAYDALVFDRPYHKAVSFEAAINEIRRCAGSHFDPTLVEPALQFLAEHDAGGVVHRAPAELAVQSV